MGTGGTEPTSSNKPTINDGPGDDTYVVVNCNIFCFDCNTIIKVLENNKIIDKRISQIKEGEQVLTYNGKKKFFSKVTKNIENKGLFEFFTIKCKDKKSNNKMISITGNHTMIVYEKLKHEIIFKYANQVQIGDLFMTSDGLFEVYEINKEMVNNSYEMRVENGTVLANDILVSTLYLEKNEIRKFHQNIINSIKNKNEILN